MEKPVNLKGYCAYSSGLFTIYEDEIKKLKRIKIVDKVTPILYFAEIYWQSIDDINLFELPENMKRNKMDSAKLLVIKFTRGSTRAKRYNNSQHLKIT